MKAGFPNGSRRFRLESFAPGVSAKWLQTSRSGVFLFQYIKDVIRIFLDLIYDEVNRLNGTGVLWLTVEAMSITVPLVVFSHVIRHKVIHMVVAHFSNDSGFMPPLTSPP